MAARSLPDVNVLAFKTLAFKTLGAVLVLSLAGCSLTAQVTTGKAYDASDGTGGAVSDVVAQNLLLITSGEGEPAVLTGALYNGSDAEVTVDVTVADQTSSFAIPAMSTVTLGLADGDEAILTDSPVAPGLNTRVTISVGSEASSTKPLPVLDGTLPEYQAVLDELADYEG